MPDPQTYRPAPGTIPTGPGVYRFRDQDGRVIYVGKAKNLRARLANYFADLASLHPRTRQMVTSAASVAWTLVGTEVEALQLEYNWIKRYDPRFNVRYRDDKTYPVLAVTVGEEHPRVFVYRGPRRKGVRYFGPYSHAWAIRETVDLLARVFPVRTCSTGVYRRHQLLDRPCLLGYIDKCAAPCVGRVGTPEYRRIVDDFCDFLAGRTGRFVASVEREMRAAATELDFERAARLRDDAEALRKALEKQTVVLGDGTDADVIAFASDELEACVQIFHVRAGRVHGQRGWVVEKDADTRAGVNWEDEALDPALPALVAGFLTRFYGDQAALHEDAGQDGVAAGGDDAVNAVVPREVLVPALPPDAEGFRSWLSGLRGAQVDLRVPRRGDKRALAETVRRNAVEALSQHKLRRAGDLTARSAALQQLQDGLGLDEAPLRIECIDVSHVQGTDVVASLVVFEDGLPRKADYRRYEIREAAGGGHSDDVASIAEVTRRRFRRHGEDCRVVPADAGLDPTPGKPRRFAYPPQLFVVDGGAPQVAAAAEVLDELGVTDVPVIGLAKRLEEVWMPGDDEPLIFPRTSEGLYLLQRIRDEAHRFAIGYHRRQRSKRMTTSALDGIPGLGPARRTALLDAFGSVAAIRSASPEEIARVPGLGPSLAAAIVSALAATPHGAARAVTVAGNGEHTEGARTDAERR